FWPHTSGFNRGNLEVGIGQDVIDEMIKRGHDVTVLPPFRISGCATAVLLDPNTGNRIAAADPRRDCYAIAY
ncbi:MAG: gamma-glutamyltransferase family protein, partial [Woeseiales bacterium]